MRSGVRIFKGGNVRRLVSALDLASQVNVV